MAARLGLVLGSVLVTLLVAELAANRLLMREEITAFFTPFEHDDSTYATRSKDPDLLLTLAWYVPGATGITGSAPVRINNLGLRDEHDYPLEKPAGCYRVLGLGDSMTFGKGVAAEDTFLAVLERRLKDHFPGRCIEILNAGMPNTNFYSQWIHYRQSWRQFSPDLVLVNFFVYNDIQLDTEEEPYFMRWMQFVDRNDWLKRSALVRWAYYRAFFDTGAEKVKEGLTRIYSPQYEGLDLFEDTLAEMKALVHSQGARLAFTLVPIPDGYDQYPHRKYHDILLDMLVRKFGIPTFDMIRGLGGVRARDHWVHPSDGHPDAYLHELMGQYLERAVPWQEWLGR